MSKTDAHPNRSAVYDYVWATVFGLAALGINQWILRLLAADSPAFFFGGALILIVFVRLGTGPGIVASLISFASFFARGDMVGYVTAIYALEAFVACRLNRRYHSLILSVMLFWFGGGWLADIVLYHWLVGVEREYVVLVFVKQIFNGIIIAMLAEVLLRIPVLNLRIPPKRPRAVTTLHAYVFNRTAFVAMLPVLVLGMPLTRTAYRHQTEQAVTRNQQLAAATSVAVAEFLENQRAVIASFARQISGVGLPASRSALDAPLDEFHTGHPEWMWIGVLDREGVVLGTSDTADGDRVSLLLRNFANSTEFEATSPRQTTRCSPVVDESTDRAALAAVEPSFCIMEPLHDSQGRFDGVIVIAVRTSAIRTLLLRTRGDLTQAVTLFDHSFRVLESLYDETEAGDYFGDFVPVDSMLGWSARSFTYFPPDDSSLESRLRLNLRHSAFQQLGSADWGVLVDLPTQSLHAEMMPTAYRVLGFLLVTLIILHFVVTNMSGKVSDPLLTIDHTATEIAAGRKGDRSAIQQLSRSPIAEVRSMAAHVRTMEVALAEKDALSQARELESEERFRATFDQAAVGIAHTDADSRFLRVNKKFCEIVGYEHHEVLRLTSFDLSHADDIDDERQRVAEVIDGVRETYTIEKRLKRRDGGSIWVQATVSLVRDMSGIPKYFIRVVEDISSRKDLEEQLLQAQKMESVGQLAGGVAHDFNNLLTPIIGYAELALADLPPDSDLRANQQRILESAQRARDLTQQLLAFGRKQVLHVSVLNLSDEISQFTGIMRRVIRENINVHLKLDARLGAVRADPSQMQQILMNLLVNAQDAMPDGGELTIETANVVFPGGSAGRMVEGLTGDCVELVVADNGQGMDSNVAAHIFEPFFTTKERGKGTGLGLATVYGIVKQHGGDITVETGPGLGTTFRVYFPQVPDEPEEELGDQADIGVYTGSETVLVAEDDDSVRQLVTDTLRDHGYEVLDAESPAVAIDRAMQFEGTIHLLLSDVVLPEMNGKQLYERLLAHRPELKVLFMSGYQEQIVDDEAVLGKPFTISRLTRSLREVLDT